MNAFQSYKYINMTLVFCVQQLNALLSYNWGSLTTVGYGFPWLTMIYHVNMSSTTVFLTKLYWIFISPMVMLHYNIHYYVSRIKFSSFGWHSCLWLTIDNLTLTFILSWDIFNCYTLLFWVGIMAKNILSLLGGHRFKSRGG